ncbi:M20/M25/M40 family metallo-hydrolase [Agromyces sp. NPDC058110]|uniref:M20/M25/M40 family metallo-hydrolase n=1 Tax=Agromyces sp. NPDC058110 TaxID=3346345 RepID=UPI0036DAF4FB
MSTTQPPTPQLLLAAARAEQPRFRGDLARIVNIDSGSYDAAGVNRVGEWAAKALTADGFDVEILETAEIDGDRFGSVVAATKRGSGTARIVLFAHLDTVFPEGTAAARPYSEYGRRAFGPGVCDDAAGIAAALTAARVLTETRFDGYKELVIVLTPDEEIGSPASRDLLASIVAGADAALCMECARENGDLVAARMGVADVLVQITGRAAHSGVEPERGIDAAIEAARFVLDAHALARPEEGLIVNVGRIEAGDRANIVPGQATLHLEVRSTRTEALLGALDALDARAEHPVVEGAAIAVTRLDVCPPLERSSTEALAGMAARVAEGLGLRAGFSATGGASDANFVAALGVPTLDGLGPIGGADHSPDEWIDLASVPDRVAMLAGLVIAVCEQDSLR